MIWVLIVLAVLLAAVIVLQLRGRAAASPESAALLAERTRMLEEEKSRAADLQARLTAANAAAAAQTALASARDAQVKAAEAETAAARQERDVLKDRLALARADVAARDARIVELQKNQAEDHARALKELEDLRTRFNTEFKNIANAIIEEKTTKLNQVNGDSLKPLLDPLNAQLKDFKAKVESLNTESVKERAALGEQVKDLMSLNKTLGKEAENLTHALTSDSQKQGHWGEIILESLLEKAGLVKGTNYDTQYQLRGDDGQPLKSQADEKKRPDAVVFLPDQRVVIIDAKCSLTAFAESVRADSTDDARAAALKAHVASVRKHVDELSAKEYEDYRRSLDFVLLFIPSEAAYAAAMQGDPDLWKYAYEKRTLITSPMTLLVSLRLIADMWKRNEQAKHVQEIADRGSRMLDKFIGFAADLEQVGKHLDGLQKAYGEAMGKLKTGPGNLTSQAAQLVKLGAKGKKDLPKSLLDGADPDVSDALPSTSSQS